LQADYMRDFLIAAFSHPSVVGVVMWGFWEGRDWYPDAALYRKDWSIKPNGRVWEDLVLKQWWTDVKGKSDKRGCFQTRGFLGDYKIEVTYKGRSKAVPVKLEKGGTKIRITLDQ
jgi:endo-1,4-beta-xylanase